MSYQVSIRFPEFSLGIRCDHQAVTGADFLPENAAEVLPVNPLAQQIAVRIAAYLCDSRTIFDFPMRLSGTPFQRKVWQQIALIPAGQVISYAELARRVDSGARAVANACGANPVPLLIPCHRVVARHGLGGFMQGAHSDALAIKRWLLMHEGVL